MFAEVVCDDLDLNPLMFVPAIATAVRQQLEQSVPQGVLVPYSDTRVVIKASLVP